MSAPKPPAAPPVYVLKSVRPPFDEYVEQLREIWDNRHFTNSGPKHNLLKERLKEFLGVPDCVLLGNGTLALVAALLALDIKDGEVITTPFTFVATAQCLEPLGLTPVFVDIEPETLTIDPAQIEKAITPKTIAILGVHVYGTPCDVEAIEKIAKKHDLKVIYDAAHAFGVDYKGQSVLNYGDASCLSFHATKAFHTFEGGAVVSRHAAVNEFVRRYRNFGIEYPSGAVLQHGLNSKMSEVHAAAGLVNLPHYKAQVAQRKVLYDRYREILADDKNLSFVSLDRQINANYNYCPVLVKNRDALFDALAANGIFTRKYFYPLLTDMPHYKSHQIHFPVASEIVKNILCLPIYPDLTIEEQDKIILTIKNF